MLESYIRHSGREWIVSGYLTHVSYGIFVKEYVMSHFVEELPCECIYAEMGGGSGVHLALFRELSKEKGRNEALLSLEKELLKECMDKGMVFSFFHRLARSCSALSDG